MTLQNNRAPFLCYYKLCASFRTHWWIGTWVTIRKRPIWVKLDTFLESCEIWRMTYRNNRTPLLSITKPYAWFHHHMWIQTGVTVRKRLSWVVTSVTLTFDLWPWPFAWTSPRSLVITPENFMMIRWWEHSQKGVTDRQTDGRTENTVHRAAWSQLKMTAYFQKTFVFKQKKIILKNKTDDERRQTLGHPRSINPSMINHVAKQSPLIFKVIYDVCTRSNKNFVFVSSRISRFKKQSKVRCQQPLSCLLTWFDRLSNTAHQYRKSISIINMYSTNNIDS